MRIAPELIKIAMCQVAPGEKTGDRVLDVLQNEETPGPTFFAFGEFDLIKIWPGVHASEINQKELYEHLAFSLRDYQETVCFGWQDVGHKLQESSAFPVWGISFCKLNGNVSTSLDLSVEHDVAKAIFANKNWDLENGQSVKAAVMGSLGWPEIVILWAADSYSAIMRCMAVLRSWQWQDLSKLSKKLEASDKTRPVFATSYTIPGVLARGKNWKDAQEHAFTLLDPDNEKLNATLLIKCTHGGQGKLKPAVQKIMQRAAIKKFLLSPVFGNYDFELSFVNKKTSAAQLATVINEIGEIPDVLTTRTIVNVADMDISNEKEYPSDPKDEKRVADEGIYEKYEDILTRLREFEKLISNPLINVSPQLTNVLARYYIVHRNPEFVGLFDDMERFVQQVFLTAGRYVAKETHLAWLDSTSRRRFDRFARVAHLFERGFEQRLNGANVGQTNSHRAVSSLRPFGIQRIIRAAESIASRSFAQIHLDGDRRIPWNGFLVFSPSSERSWLPFGVISVPRGDLFNPHHWGLISHACGHDFFDLANWAQHNTIRAVIENLSEYFVRTNTHTHGDMSRSQAEHVVEELVADVFDFHVASGGNWELYRSTVWEHLNLRFQGQQLSEDFITHVARAVFMGIYSLRWNGSIREEFPTLESVIKTAQAMGDRLYSAPDQFIDPSMVDRGVRYNFIHLWLKESGGSVKDVLNKFMQFEIKPYLTRCVGLIDIIDLIEIEEIYRIVEPLQIFLCDQMEALIPDSPILSNRIQRDAKKLQKGEIIGEDNLEPMHIVAAALTCAKEDPDQLYPWRIAAILSIGYCSDLCDEGG